MAQGPYCLTAGLTLPAFLYSGESKYRVKFRFSLTIPKIW